MSCTSGRTNEYEPTKEEKEQHCLHVSEANYRKPSRSDLILWLRGTRQGDLIVLRAATPLPRRVPIDVEDVIYQITQLDTNKKKLLSQGTLRSASAVIAARREPVAG